ncbi:MAG: PilZ domain-containing protein [Clostridiales bacterium]|jgi:c-di-GMP-binding flagellar brake protein YcgR|nr:PilZ domain-containing protein [Clostridiales bacterium]
MLFDNIKAGDRLEITKKNSKPNIKPATYVSQVEEVIPAKSQVVIFSPISYGEIIRIDKDEYTMLFYCEKGMMQFSAVGITNVKDSGQSFAVLKLTNKGERIQRRYFYRLDCIIPFKFGILERDKMNTAKRKDLFSNVSLEGIIKDISGGGIRFLSNEEIEANMYICCIIPVENEVLLPIGRVLTKQHFPKSNYKYQYRLLFEAILPEDQERIVQYVFNEQRKTLGRTRD